MLADPVAKLENWESIKEEMASSNVIQRSEACCEKIPRSPLESLGWFKQIHDKANQLGIRLRMAFKKLYQTCLRFCFGWKYHFTSPKQEHQVEKSTQKLSMGGGFLKFQWILPTWTPFHFNESRMILNWNASSNAINHDLLACSMHSE